MPIKIPDRLPAKDILKRENIFVMDNTRAISQDIRPIEIAIVNLMPLKEVTEVQLLRLLGNTPLQVNVTFLHMASHFSKNTGIDHLSDFYHTFEEIKHRRFDGMVITGAPIENFNFEDVTYWKEITDIMSWSLDNVTSVLHICWGAQAGMYYHYGIQKYPLSNKMFGVFPHYKTTDDADILRGFDDVFYVPQSRYTENRREDILKKGDGLTILAESDSSGVYIVASKNSRKHVFVTGHSEYDPLTLKEEYERDLAKGCEIAIPFNYFPEDNVAKPPTVSWRSHSNLLFSNWLNYYVYQVTPYQL